jgi:hypothetical protein
MASDPTLRPGDIVVTKDGLMAYTGKSGQAGAFTPVDAARISAELNSVTVPPRVAQHAEQPATQSAQDEPGHDALSPSAQIQDAPPQNAQLPFVVNLQPQDAR